MMKNVVPCKQWYAQILLLLTYFKIFIDKMKTNHLLSSARVGQATHANYDLSSSVRAVAS